MRKSVGLFLALLSGTACGGAQAIDGTQARMDFTARTDFYAAPFPSEHLRGADGRIGLLAFPNPTRVDLLTAARTLIESDSDGFGQTSGIYFSMTAAIDAAKLPDIHATAREGSPIFLIGVDRAAPDFGKRYPLAARFAADPGPFGAPNLLELLPVQGLPLRPKTLYAAVILRSLDDLGVSLSMAQLAAGEAPGGLVDPALAKYRAAVQALGEMGISGGSISGLAVFETGDPAAGLNVLRDAAASDASLAPLGEFVPKEIFDDYCVFTSTVSMPDYQSGDPPFASTGGGILLDGSGHPVLQRREDARLVVTIPRRPMPPDGYPLAVFIRTGGGGERPLVDRGVHATPHGEAIEPGAGPALHFARAGFAGASVDGPHGGLRNITHGDEQFLVINVFNPVALRDNIRQSAIELALLPGFFSTLSIDASRCPGATSPARFDGTRVALMGHSMGATIAPLVLAAQPAYGAAILSGAGGSWIENVIYKKSPVVVSGVAKVVLGYADSGRELEEHDPALTLIQWAGEGADPPVYARSIGQHVLMFQGIEDTYIEPPIANATSLSLGLDLAAPALEPSLPGLIDLSGGSIIELPYSGNVVVQHMKDRVEDGHEVVFQTPEPKHQYRCFLESFAAGAPRVVKPGAEDASCAN